MMLIHNRRRSEPYIIRSSTSAGEEAGGATPAHSGSAPLTFQADAVERRREAGGRWAADLGGEGGGVCLFWDAVSRSVRLEQISVRGRENHSLHVISFIGWVLTASLQSDGGDDEAVSTWSERRDNDDDYDDDYNKKKMESMNEM